MRDGNTPKRKLTLSVDFDATIHGYQSGWQGAAVCNDPIVPGSIEWLIETLDTFEIAIFSARSRSWRGRRAMRKYIISQFCAMCPTYNDTPKIIRDWITTTAFADPWKDEVKYAAHRLVRKLHWPIFKPSAFLTIDDRALQFKGNWGQFPAKKLLEFRPWNK